MPRTIHVAHSPDSDDAFMFYALAEGKIDTGDLRYVHELSDIESLNRRALNGELEVTAVSIHAYAYLRPDLRPAEQRLVHGRSLRSSPGWADTSPADPRGAPQGHRIGVPGKLTTAYLALKLLPARVHRGGPPLRPIEDAVLRGRGGCGTADSRGSADLPGPGPPPLDRPGRMVVPGDRTPPPAGRATWCVAISGRR